MIRSVLLTTLLLFSVPSFALTNLQCKLAAIKYEADQNNIRDKKLVLSVINNRQHLQHKTACAIVLAPKQFSFVSKRTNWKYSEKQLQEYWKLVEYPPVVGKDVVSFHRIDVRPGWVRFMRKRGRIGKHYFYSELKEK